MILIYIRKLVLIAIAVLSIALFFIIISAFAEEYEVKTFQVRSADPQTLISVAETVKSAGGKLVYDKRTNSLVAVDTPENLKAIADIIEKVDIQQRQVQINSVIAEVTESFLKDAGIEMASVVIPSHRFEAVLTLLKSRQDCNIRSGSMVRALSNQPAQIKLTSDFFVGEEVVMYDSGTKVVSPVKDEVGSVLEVLPRVNDDNTIAMHIEPSYSNLQGSTNLPLERSLSTDLVINSGDTIVIGGVNLKEQTQQKQYVFGIPVSNKEVEASREIIIFLTATIME